MLYEEGVSARMNKQRVATIICHELAHQWFGNLVTPGKISFFLFVQLIDSQPLKLLYFFF